MLAIVLLLVGRSSAQLGALSGLAVNGAGVVGSEWPGVTCADAGSPNDALSRAEDAEAIRT